MNLDKRKTIENLQRFCDSEEYRQLYNEIRERQGPEEATARVFNTALIFSQLVSDYDAMKKAVVEWTSGYAEVNDFSIHFALRTIAKYDEDYKVNAEEKALERLRHGFAVHFTTPKILDRIRADGVMKAHQSMFTKETEQKIFDAARYQREHNSEADKTLNYLQNGFGFSDGISMSAQTTPFWMNRTPESLLFLFGSAMCTRNKEEAFKNIEQKVSSLPEEEKKNMLEILGEIWDELIGEDKSLGCVLIDRDALEYEKVTYWKSAGIPDRIEEIRPYRNGFIDISAMEESRYRKDISCAGLGFIKVPAIPELEMYRASHPIPKEEKAPEEWETEDIDIFGDEIQ